MPQFNSNLNKDELEVIKPGSTVISFIQPGQNKEIVQKLK